MQQCYGLISGFADPESNLTVETLSASLGQQVSLTCRTANPKQSFWSHQTSRTQNTWERLTVNGTVLTDRQTQFQISNSSAGNFDLIIKSVDDASMFGLYSCGFESDTGVFRSAKFNIVHSQTLPGSIL